MLAGGVAGAGSQCLPMSVILAAVLGAGRRGAAVCPGVRGDAATSGTCAARPDLGAAAPCTVGRGGLIMKVAQLLTASTGGIGRHVASIAPRLEQRGHQVRVFCPEATAEAQGFKELGLDVWPLTSLRRFIGADLVHAHGLKAGWLGTPDRLDVPRTARRDVAQRSAGRRTRACSGAADVTGGGDGGGSDAWGQQRSRRSGHPTRSPERAAVTDRRTGASARKDQPRRSASGSRCCGWGHGQYSTVSRLAPQKNLGMVLDIAAAVLRQA